MYTINQNGKSHPFSTWAEVLFALNDRSTTDYFLSSRRNPVTVTDMLARRTYEVAFVSTYRCGPVLHGHICALEYLETMLREAHAKTRLDTFSQIQPHEMPQAMWDGIVKIVELLNNNDTFTSQQREGPFTVGGVDHVYLSDAVDALMTKLFGYPSTGPRHQPATDGNDHIDHVAYALLRGDDVPEATLAHYATVNLATTSYRSIQWMDALLKRPFLRGKFKCALHLNFLLTQEGKPDSRINEITSENLGYLCHVLQAASADATWNELDDLFYEKRILVEKVLPEVTVAPENAKGINPLAQAIFDELVASTRKERLQILQQRIDAKQMNKRETAVEHLRIVRLESSESYQYPNNMARAVANRDMKMLMEVLDHTGNDSTKRGIRKITGINLLTLTGERRVREIFRVAGYHDDADFKAAKQLYIEQVLAAEKAKAEEERKAEEAARLPNARALAERFTCTYEDQRLNGAQFIDKLISQGFTQLVKAKKGATTQYQLRMPPSTSADTTSYFVLKVSDGLVDYATLMTQATENALQGQTTGTANPSGQ